MILLSVPLLVAIPMMGSALAAPPSATETDRPWWAFQPIRNPAPPLLADVGWCRNEIDHFVLQKLDQAGLKPAPEAERAVLIRRLYFDMLGLPPTAEAIRAFISDKSDTAYEELIDRLLASPHYGERWARFWLDLVRYADSDGYRFDDYRPHAWRFRDYVIDAFNRDKPYDRFVKEQIAGDELFPGDPEALVATGYLRHWAYEFNNTDVRRQWARILDDITDTTGDVFFALSFQCARCHHHKSDPIRREDYYRLQAFFAPILPRDDLPATVSRALTADTKRQQAWERATAGIRREMALIEEKHVADPATGRLKKLPKDIQLLFAKAAEERTPLEKQLVDLAARQLPPAVEQLEEKLSGQEKEHFRKLRQRLEEFDAVKPAALPAAFAATDVGPSAPPTFMPGNNSQPIEPGLPAILDPLALNIVRPAGAPNSTGRRAALAGWLTRPDNPLTARIIVNRVWQQHFGRGLAMNTSEFGRDGGLPSHPELLDWLARRLVRDGWSLKKLHHLILTSATYRQSSGGTPHGNELDPENRLLGRAPVRRLDADQVRDAILAVSGELRLEAGGPSVNPAVPRRTIYTKSIRNTRDPLLEAFDAPPPFASACSRDTTTTSTQSLYLLNSQLMIEAAKAFARRLHPQAKVSDEITSAYWIAYGRAPSSDELAAADGFMRSQQPQIDPAQFGSPEAAFLRSRFPYRDGWAAVLTPDGAQRRLEAPIPSATPVGSFSIEAYQLLRSFGGHREPSPIAGKRAGGRKRGGWEFGVYQPDKNIDAGVLALRMAGQDSSGRFTDETYYSELRINLEKPYYLAVTVQLADPEKCAVIFYAKDLADVDRPLLSSRVPIAIRSGIANTAPLGIGRSAVPRSAGFDGLIEEVRFTDGCLSPTELLYSGNDAHPKAIGHWRFEPATGVFCDSTPHRFDIRPPAGQPMDRSAAALVDLCHTLLISNEFLYID